MKKLNEKRFLNRSTATMMLMMASTAMSFAANSDFSKILAPITELLESLLGPVLGVVAALGTLYCVLLGVKFAKAEEPQDREKAKTHLKNAVIGFVLIFVLILGLKMLMPAMKTWVNNYATDAEYGNSDKVFNTK